MSPAHPTYTGPLKVRVLPQGLSGGGMNKPFARTMSTWANIPPGYESTEAAARRLGNTRPSKRGRVKGGTMTPEERRIDLLRESLQDMIELAYSYVGPGDPEGQLSIRRAGEAMELTATRAEQGPAVDKAVG